MNVNFMTQFSLRDYFKRKEFKNTSSEWSKWDTKLYAPINFLFKMRRETSNTFMKNKINTWRLSLLVNAE